MGWASYKAPSQASQLNNPHRDRDADLTGEPEPSRRGDQPWQSPPSHGTPLAVVNPRQLEEPQQEEENRNRQGQQQNALQHKNSRRQRKRWRRKLKRYFRRRPPGMCAPHNTSQYIMDQHEYVLRDEEKGAVAMFGGSGNYSSGGEDEGPLLMVYLPFMAREIEGTSRPEKEEESTQPASQD